MPERLTEEEIAETKWKWECGDRLRHVASGEYYVVNDCVFDEATKAPAYVYAREWNPLDGYGPPWVRSRDEMEDGRFVYEPKPTEANLVACIKALEESVVKLAEDRDAEKRRAEKAEREWEDWKAVTMAARKLLVARTLSAAALEALRHCVSFAEGELDSETVESAWDALNKHAATLPGQP